MKPICRRIRSGGRTIEVWENPDVPFECSAEELERWVADSDWPRDWVLVFNALTLAGGRVYTV